MKEERPKEYFVSEKRIDLETLKRHDRVMRQSSFVHDFLERKKAEYKDLGKFEDDKPKLIAEGNNLWNEYDALLSKMFKLQERAEREITNWKVIEKIYKAYLKIECLIHPEVNAQTTLEIWKSNFDHSQHLVTERIKHAEYIAAGGELGDFQRRILDPDPGRRGEALQYFLKDNVDKGYYLIETVKLILDELLKRR